MKLLLFSGSHSRHIFVNLEVLKHCDEALCLIIEREEVEPAPPKDISDKDKCLFIKHFFYTKNFTCFNFNVTSLPLSCSPKWLVDHNSAVRKR